MLNWIHAFLSKILVLNFKSSEWNETLKGGVVYCVVHMSHLKHWTPTISLLLDISQQDSSVKAGQLNRWLWVDCETEKGSFFSCCKCFFVVLMSIYCIWSHIGWIMFVQGSGLNLVQPGRSIFGFSWSWIVIARVCPDTLSYTVVINPPPSSQAPACSVHIMIFWSDV